MEPIKPIFISVLFVAITGCNLLRNTSNEGPPDGDYRSRVAHTKKVYVLNRGDSMMVYKLVKAGNGYVADTLPASITHFLPLSSRQGLSPRFRVFTFDFDLLTIPFKYRPAAGALPPQFTTSLNGAAYLGLRADSYKLRYKKDFFNYYRRRVSHYAVSLGMFTGLGSTAMNPWVTNYAIGSEYEGVAWSKGVAFIMAAGKFTSGLSLGWDHLLDKNKSSWIYEGKPWIGLVFGFNLN